MKKMLFVRLLLIVLALSLSVGLLSACSDKEGDENQTKDASLIQNGQDESGLYDENGYLLDQLPDHPTFNVDSNEFRILGWKSYEEEFGCEEYNGEVINDSLVDRDSQIENRLGVVLNYNTDYTGGTAQKHVEEYTSHVESLSKAGDYYDMIATYSRTAAVLSCRGFYSNLLSIKDSYLNFENPWWTTGLLDELQIGNSLYIVSGDISPTVIELVYGMFFNEEMIESRGLKSPYDLVADDEWTIDVFREYSKDVEEDSNGQLYGYGAAYWTVPALLHGCGIRIMERDEDELMIVSPGLFGEKAIGLMDEFKEWASAANYLISDSSGGSENTEAEQNFINGRVMFATYTIGAAMKYNTNAGLRYGIVPMPKYEQAQTRYYSTLHTSITCFAIMAGLSDESLLRSTAVMECMASEGYRHTTPAVFDLCLAGRFSQTAEMAEMMRKIVKTVTFDFGRLYSSKETSYICDIPGRIIQSTQAEYKQSWSGWGSKNLEVLKNQFKINVIDRFVEMEGN